MTLGGELRRIIPVVLLKNGNVVQSYGFEHHPIIGSPSGTLERLLNYQSDEVIILDISSNTLTEAMAINRPDTAEAKANSPGLLDVLARHAQSLLYPLAVGGGIRHVSQAEELVSVGADKVVLNYAILHDLELVKSCVDSLGSQGVVASVDVLETEDGFEVYDAYASDMSRGKNGLLELLRIIEEVGCGEIFLNNVSRDGARAGQNLELITTVGRTVSIPLISCGGVGKREDFQEALEVGADAVAAANFFHSHEMSYPLVKRTLAAHVPTRNFDARQDLLTRERDADDGTNVARVLRRVDLAEQLYESGYQGYVGGQKHFVRCAECLYPLNSATSLAFSRLGVCSGCARHSAAKVDRARRPANSTLSQILQEAAGKNRSSDYDCIVAVSGGKDSYFQVHYVTQELGLRPLLVTYDANNWTPVGLENLKNMEVAFGVDHLIVSPPEALLKNMNLAGFLMVGDMNWHAHVGIFTSPMKIAADYGIPLVFYGEHGREDLAGQFRYGDFPEINYRERLEHHGRGLEWTKFQGLFGVSNSDLDYWKYPGDDALYESGLRGLHLGSFIDWNPHLQTELVKRLYNFRESDDAFDRTYRRGSNLDDMHENGLHDWLKYVKFGYGRGTDHGSKDTRLGRFTRDEALRLARRYDAVLPNDIGRWLEYVELNRDVFFAISNSFRSPAVWNFDGSSWLHPEGMLDQWLPRAESPLAVNLRSLRERIQGGKQIG